MRLDTLFNPILQLENLITMPPLEIVTYTPDQSKYAADYTHTHT